MKNSSFKIKTLFIAKALQFLIFVITLMTIFIGSDTVLTREMFLFGGLSGDIPKASFLPGNQCIIRPVKKIGIFDFPASMEYLTHYYVKRGGGAMLQA